MTRGSRHLTSHSFITVESSALTERYGLDIAKKLLQEIGGWPILEEFWNEFGFDWTKNVEALRKKGLSVNSLVDISVGLDFKHSDKRIIQVLFVLPVVPLLKTSL